MEEKTRKSLPGYHVLQPGETVKVGDYLQIGPTYYLVDGSVWVGDVIKHGGPFETVWHKMNGKGRRLSKMQAQNNNKGLWA